MPVALLLRSMSSAEFAEWQAFAALEPFGPAREDERAGQVAAVIANVNRPKGHEPFTPASFFPNLVEERPAVPLLAKLKATFAHFPRKRKG